MTTKTLVSLLFALALSGCMGDGNQRIQGLTSGAGNAIAANTVMQMVDPWQAGIDDTDLMTPAERTPNRPVAAPGSDIAATNK